MYYSKFNSLPLDSFGFSQSKSMINFVNSILGVDVDRVMI